MPLVEFPVDMSEAGMKDHRLAAGLSSDWKPGQKRLLGGKLDGLQYTITMQCHCTCIVYIYIFNYIFIFFVPYRDTIIFLCAWLQYGII